MAKSPPPPKGRLTSKGHDKPAYREGTTKAPRRSSLMPVGGQADDGANSAAAGIPKPYTKPKARVRMSARRAEHHRILTNLPAAAARRSNAEALFRRKQYNEAIQAFKDIIGNNINDTNSYYYLACSYIALSQPRSGIDVLNTAIKRRHNSTSHLTKIYKTLAFTLAGIGETKLALEAFIACRGSVPSFENADSSSIADEGTDRFLRSILIVEEIKILIYDNNMDTVKEKISELSEVTAVPARAIRKFIKDFQRRAEKNAAAPTSANRSSARKESEREALPSDDAVDASGAWAPAHRDDSAEAPPDPAKAARTIAGLHASLAELSKIDLTSITPEEEAIRQARNLAGTADRLRARGQEIPAYAAEPVRRASRMIRAYHRRKAKSPQPN
jgi:tetratricopeptide (TPR) repeat protein